MGIMASDINQPKTNMKEKITKKDIEVRNFYIGLLLFLLLVLFLFCITLVFEINNYYNAGYTKGYDSLNNEIYNSYDKTSCGSYLNLNNHNQTIKLWKYCDLYFGNITLK